MRLNAVSRKTFTLASCAVAGSRCTTNSQSATEGKSSQVSALLGTFGAVSHTMGSGFPERGALENIKIHCDCVYQTIRTKPAERKGGTGRKEEKVGVRPSIMPSKKERRRERCMYIFVCIQFSAEGGTLS